MASVRLRDLCERLGVDASLRAKMWTCFEHSLRNRFELMEGRHLDQLIMCAIYVMAKVRSCTAEVVRACSVQVQG